MNKANHLIVEAHGIPLAVTLTGGNRNDVTQLIPLIQAVPPIRGKRGLPLHHQGSLTVTTRSQSEKVSN